METPLFDTRITEAEFDKHLDSVIDFSGLTRQEEALLRYVCRCMHRGFCPSLADVTARFDMKRTAIASRKLKVLVKKGKMERKGNQRRLSIPSIRWMPVLVNESEAIGEDVSEAAAAEVRRQDSATRAYQRHKVEREQGILIIRKLRRKPGEGDC